MNATVETHRPRLRWWRESAYIGVFYLLYSVVRDLQGSSHPGDADSLATVTARRHARLVVRIERDLHIFHEAAIQRAFLHGRLFVQFWNTYYGVAHFVVTAGALLWLFHRDKRRYPLWRNTLAVTTGLALIGFAVFPLMPPRLLTHYGFVDTLRVYGGPWSFGSGPVERVSNQYAAMPSLHFGWSLWSTGALYPCCRRWWTRALVVAYPALTLFAIVVTANHYFLDAAGGALVFAVALTLANWATPRSARLLAARRFPGRRAPAGRPTGTDRTRAEDTRGVGGA